MSYIQTYPLWRHLHPGRIAYSWTHGSGDRALRIDMVWAPTAMADSIEECEYHPSFLTDHQYLLVKFHPLPKIDSLEIQYFASERYRVRQPGELFLVPLAVLRRS